MRTGYKCSCGGVARVYKSRRYGLAIRRYVRCGWCKKRGMFRHQIEADGTLILGCVLATGTDAIEVDSTGAMMDSKETTTDGNQD